MLSLENSKRLSTLAKEFGVEVSDKWFMRVKKGDLINWLYEILVYDTMKYYTDEKLSVARYLDMKKEGESVYDKPKSINAWVSQDVIPALEEVIKNKKGI